jgi:hypothetical protein
LDYNEKISDHLPVLLQLDSGSDIVRYPFKFNAIWLEDQDFVSLVKNSWVDLLGTKVLPPMESLVKKLKRLKNLVIVWERKKKAEGKKELVQLDSELDELYSEFPGGFVEDKVKISVLDKEQRKMVLLKQEEETWRQKSRVNWLAAGDRNTKKFHAYASSRKQINTIWDITKGDGTIITNSSDLQKEAVDYFQDMFKAQDNLAITDQLVVLRNFPRMISEAEGNSIIEPVSLAEILKTLKGFNSSKIPGPDGWTVEFFLAFFDIVGNELLEVVEESRRLGKVTGALNATFIALIPKSDKPDSFGGFRPIALCNLVYKIITKTIATKLKTFILWYFKRTIWFLEGRQINDAIGVVQEVVHSIKVKNIKELVLKLDLVKAYDRVDWGFLILVLLQIGLSLEATDWIMGCVTSTNFVVLINGKPTSFFKSSRGLRQGCPLSPLLFLIIIEGLSRIIQERVKDKKLEGVPVARGLNITHLMFVDDVILFGIGCMAEWKVYKEILELFCKATGMEFNQQKSLFLEAGWDDAELVLLKDLFPFEVKPLETGFKYLGFYIKPNCYTRMDWLWLEKKFEKRILSWSHRWLTLGGRVILVKAVLESISVYWLSLEKIPKSVLNNIRRRMFNFLWSW